MTSRTGRGQSFADYAPRFLQELQYRIRDRLSANGVDGVVTLQALPAGGVVFLSQLGSEAPLYLVEALEAAQDLVEGMEEFVRARAPDDSRGLLWPVDF